MKDTIKKYGFITGCMIVLGAAISSLVIIVNDRSISDAQEIPKADVKAQYVDDYDNMNSLKNHIDMSDHVFVGKVKAYKGTNYVDEYTFTDSNKNKKKVANIFTEFEVSVLKDFKNELNRGDVVTVEKLGGIDENNNYVHILENDEMLKEGKEYLFMLTSAKYDYMACGSYSTMDLNEIKNFEIAENLEQLRNCEIIASDK